MDRLRCIEVLIEVARGGAFIAFLRDRASRPPEWASAPLRSAA